MPGKTKSCKDCKFYFDKDKCERAEYKSNRRNREVYEAYNYKICELFQLEDVKKQSKRNPRIIYKDSGTANQGYFEAIYHDSKPYFLVANDKKFSLHETVTFGDKTFTPKDTQRFPYDAYGYFKGSIPNRDRLFWKVREEFQTFIDLEAIWIDVLSASVLLSYQQEKLQTVPYLFVYGDNESGKSTVLQLLKFLCYRPMYGVTVPSADIYGYLDDVNSIRCVLEDEIQGIDKDTDKIKIYKAGYKKGAVVPRTIMTRNDRIIKYYNTFCFKAVASEKIPTVKGFRERFIEINMVEGYPCKEWADITEEDLSQLRELRDILLKWRMLSRDWALPNPKISIRGRLKEIWKPILQVTHGLAIFDNLAGFIENQKNERLFTKQNSLEGHVVKAVVDLFNASKENRTYLHFSSIWDRLIEDLDGKIEANKPHVMDTPEFFRVSKHKVGYRLREVLGSKSKTVRNGDTTIKAYEFDHKKLRRIAKKYGYELVTKLPLLPISKGMQEPISQTNYSEGNAEKHVATPLVNGNISNIETKTSKSSPTKCCVCHQPILLLSTLSNVDGLPAHKQCVEELEARRRVSQWS